ncbi:hypothetical protein PCE1_002682 [Barthelona sp. PCE]
MGTPSELIGRWIQYLSTKSEKALDDRLKLSAVEAISSKLELNTLRVEQLLQTDDFVYALLFSMHPNHTFQKVQPQLFLEHRSQFLGHAFGILRHIVCTADGADVFSNEPCKGIQWLKDFKKVHPVYDKDCENIISTAHQNMRLLEEKFEKQEEQPQKPIRKPPSIPKNFEVEIPNIPQPITNTMYSTLASQQEVTHQIYSESNEETDVFVNVPTKFTEVLEYWIQMSKGVEFDHKLMHVLLHYPLVQFLPDSVFRTISEKFQSYLTDIEKEDERFIGVYPKKLYTDISEEEKLALTVDLLNYSSCVQLAIQTRHMVSDSCLLQNIINSLLMFSRYLEILRRSPIHKEDVLELLNRSVTNERRHIYTVYELSLLPSKISSKICLDLFLIFNQHGYPAIEGIIDMLIKPNGDFCSENDYLIYLLRSCFLKDLTERNASFKLLLNQFAHINMISELNHRDFLNFFVSLEKSNLQLLERYSPEVHSVQRSAQLLQDDFDGLLNHTTEALARHTPLLQISQIIATWSSCVITLADEGAHDQLLEVHSAFVGGLTNGIHGVEAQHIIIRFIACLVFYGTFNVDFVPNYIRYIHSADKQVSFSALYILGRILFPLDIEIDKSIFFVPHSLFHHSGITPSKLFKDEPNSEEVFSYFFNSLVADEPIHCVTHTYEQIMAETKRVYRAVSDMTQFEDMKALYRNDFPSFVHELDVIINAYESLLPDEEQLMEFKKALIRSILDVSDVDVLHCLQRQVDPTHTIDAIMFHNMYMPEVLDAQISECVAILLSIHLDDDHFQMSLRLIHEMFTRSQPSSVLDNVSVRLFEIVCSRLTKFNIDAFVSVLIDALKLSLFSKPTPEDIMRYTDRTVSPLFDNTSIDYPVRLSVLQQLFSFLTDFISSSHPADVRPVICELEELTMMLFKSFSVWHVTLPIMEYITSFFSVFCPLTKGDCGFLMSVFEYSVSINEPVFSRLIPMLSSDELSTSDMYTVTLYALNDLCPEESVEQCVQLLLGLELQPNLLLVEHNEQTLMCKFFYNLWLICDAFLKDNSEMDDDEMDQMEYVVENCLEAIQSSFFIQFLLENDTIALVRLCYAYPRLVYMLKTHNYCTIIESAVGSIKNYQDWFVLMSFMRPIHKDITNVAFKTICERMCTDLEKEFKALYSLEDEEVDFNRVITITNCLHFVYTELNMSEKSSMKTFIVQRIVRLFNMITGGIHTNEQQRNEFMMCHLMVLACDLTVSLANSLVEAIFSKFDVLSIPIVTCMGSLFLVVNQKKTRACIFDHMIQRLDDSLSLLLTGVKDSSVEYFRADCTVRVVLSYLSQSEDDILLKKLMRQNIAFKRFLEQQQIGIENISLYIAFLIFYIKGDARFLNEDNIAELFYVIRKALATDLSEELVVRTVLFVYVNVFVFTKTQGKNVKMLSMLSDCIGAVVDSHIIEDTGFAQKVIDLVVGIIEVLANYADLRIVVTNTPLKDSVADLFDTVESLVDGVTIPKAIVEFIGNKE